MPIKRMIYYVHEESRLMREEDFVTVAIGFRYLEYFIKNKASDE